MQASQISCAGAYRQYGTKQDCRIAPYFIGRNRRIVERKPSSLRVFAKFCTLKYATYSLVGRLIDRMRRHFDRSQDINDYTEELSVEIDHYPNTKYQTIFALALYTGLRPNEYNTAKIEGQFIVAVNSKRKHKRVEYKRIPITPMLAPYVQGITSFEIVNRDVIREKFKAILPNHIVYDMRTTFYSRCKECGIADAARDEFVGHSLGALGNAYTDLSDEYLLQEGAKFKC